jgi:hypothetical protein
MGASMILAAVPAFQVTDERISKLSDLLKQAQEADFEELIDRQSLSGVEGARAELSAALAFLKEIESRPDVTTLYPNCEPPAYLQQLSPELYEEESRRVQARFEECIRLAEETFTDEFGRLVAHLTERLSGSDDGKPKVFRDSAVQNLAEFFQRFRHLNVRSSEQLDQFVDQAQRIVRGVKPQALRDDTGLRQQIVSQLAGVQSQIEGMLVDRPRRAILRRPR